MARYFLLMKMILNSSHDDELSKYIEDFFKKVINIEANNTP